MNGLQVNTDIKSLLYKAEKLSVRLSVTTISQPCLHRLKWDLLEMKAESSGTTKFVFKSLNVRLVIHTSAQKGTGASYNSH